MSPVLVGLVVTGSIVLTFATLFFLLWAGNRVERKITGDPGAGLLGGLSGVFVWFAIFMGVIVALTEAGVLK